MLHECLAAAGILEQEHGVSVEVVDLRCVRPLDTATILESTAKTGRVVVATEAWPFGGIAAEVVAIISSEAFHLLDAPPRRICAQDTPIPVQPDLYAAHRPHAADVVTAVLETVRY